MTLNQKYQPTSQHKSTRNRKNKIIMFLMVSFFIVFIAKKEVPFIDETLNQFIAPKQTMAKKTCHQRAMELGQKPDFARIMQPGQISKTQQGFLVSQIRVGEMGSNGHEITFNVTCYTDGEGQLVRAEISSGSN